MWVTELMTDVVLTVSPDMPVKSAMALLVKNELTAAPVVATSGELVGIVSGIDLVRHDVGPDPRAHMILQRPSGSPPKTVADVMSRRLVTTQPHADVADAIVLMDRHQLRSLPVVDERKVVGMLSRSDVLRVLARTDADLASAVLQRLHDCYGRASAEIDVDVDEGVVVLSLPSEEIDPEVAMRVAETVPGVVRVRAR